MANRQQSICSRQLPFCDVFPAPKKTNFQAPVLHLSAKAHMAASTDDRNNVLCCETFLHQHGVNLDLARHEKLATWEALSEACNREGSADIASRLGVTLEQAITIRYDNDLIVD